MTNLRAITITHVDREWHEAYLDFVPKVFPRISFRAWYEHGGWDDGYVAFALVDGDRIVANAAVSRMNLVFRGEPSLGWQLGAVGTLPDLRGRGLQNQLIPRLLEHTGSDDLVFLFANHHVLDFYPRFGFERVRESIFVSEHRVSPSGTPLRVLELENPQDRALLQRVAAEAEPVTELFGARDYGNTVLWYWSNFYRDGLRYDAEHDAILIVDQSNDLLRVYDILSRKQLDLRSFVPRVISAPIAQVEFGFTPSRYWPTATPKADYTDSPLFALRPHPLPNNEHFKFPMLAQT
jgi:predicted N-acetyltransferase YhbS